MATAWCTVSGSFSAPHRFALPSPTDTLPLPTGQHVSLRCINPETWKVRSPKGSEDRQRQTGMEDARCSLRVLWSTVCLLSSACSLSSMLRFCVERQRHHAYLNG